jgi:hypothetical protein
MRCTVLLLLSLLASYSQATAATVEATSNTKTGFAMKPNPKWVALGANGGTGIVSSTGATEHFGSDKAEFELIKSQTAITEIKDRTKAPPATVFGPGGNFGNFGS